MIHLELSYLNPLIRPSFRAASIRISLRSIPVSTMAILIGRSLHFGRVCVLASFNMRIGCTKGISRSLINERACICHLGKVSGKFHPD
jgi:hypothetical protein